MDICGEITKWFERHHSVQKIVKGTVFAFLGLVVATQGDVVSWIETQIQTALPEWIPLWFLVKPLIIGLFIGLGNWIQHNTTLPVIGKKNEKPSKKSEK